MWPFRSRSCVINQIKGAVPPPNRRCFSLPPQPSSCMVLPMPVLDSIDPACWTQLHFCPGITHQSNVLPQHFSSLILRLLILFWTYLPYPLRRPRCRRRRIFCCLHPSKPHTTVLTPHSFLVRHRDLSGSRPPIITPPLSTTTTTTCARLERCIRSLTIGFLPDLAPVSIAPSASQPTADRLISFAARRTSTPRIVVRQPGFCESGHCSAIE